VSAVLAAGTRPAVVAVDLPSGLSPDDGRVFEPLLRADVTVTFGAVKAGLLLEPGASAAGRVVLVDLGLGPHLHGEPVVPGR
jgi:NAD(P)H-hydrate repair Nnr-like enzyme with NAD(P)H-hydrate epimerase domain